MGRLDGKVALITGGAGGMGASHVRAFLREGARVVFGDISAERGRALSAELGEDCSFLPHDVRLEADWAGIVEEATSRFGKLDVLVNNAGILRFSSFAEMGADEFRQVLEVNVVSQWLGVKHASAAMGSGGSIVNISSVNGLVGGAGLSAYSASKFAIRGVTRCAAVELGRARIRVNSVHPGAVATPMIGVEETDVGGTAPLEGLPVPRMAAPQEITNMVLFLASDESSYCTGGEYVVDGGMTAGAGF